MAQHKAPTQVTVVDHEKSAFAQWVENNWIYGAIGAVVITVAVLGQQYLSSQKQTEQMAIWEQLDALAGAEEGERDALLQQLEGTPAEGWAWLSEFGANVSEREYDDARAALQRVRASGESTLTEETFALGASDSQQTLADHLEALAAAQEAWESERPSLFANPPLPEGSPQVRLETTAGNIVLGLYEEKAPLHVANFLKLCDEGYYDGTRFHRVIRGFMIQGGDPNSKEDDVTAWGQGGPDETIPKEINDLFHFRGVLSAAKKPQETQSSGSQFFIATGEPHHLDGQHVVYGVVLEGLDAVDAIEAGEIDSTTQDRPVEPVTIVKTVRL